MSSQQQASELVLLGAGRHGANVLDICLDLGKHVRGFLDDTKKTGTEVNGVPVLGPFVSWPDHAQTKEVEFLVAIGATAVRRTICSEIAASGATLARVIHPSCQISYSADIGSGVVLSPYCRVMAHARVGRYSLLEGYTAVGAEVVVGEAVSTGLHVTLTARASVGAGTFIGSGVVVSGPARVGAECIVGANATVLRDLPDRVFAVGTPATIKRRLSEAPNLP